MSRLDPTIDFATLAKKITTCCITCFALPLYSSFMMHAVHYMRKMFIKKVRKYNKNQKKICHDIFPSFSFLFYQLIIVFL